MKLSHRPVKYKALFGTTAETSLQATFKVVTHLDIVVNNNDINPRVIEAPIHTLV